jgi:hypothetical protein
MTDTPKIEAAAYELNPSFPMYADRRALWLNWYDFPREDPAHPEVYTYTDSLSYDPGDEVAFHVSSTAAAYSIEVVRDGLRPESVHRSGDLRGAFHPTPKTAYKTGCEWPAAHRWQIPKTMPSGFYRVISRCLNARGSPFLQHHGFVVRPTPATRGGRLLMILPTATWTAYNDWGGANHYEGIDGPQGNNFSPELSLRRPWSRGIIWLPQGAPRIGTVPKPAPGDVPRYSVKEWAYAHAYARYYAASGWAQYDRLFLIWAQREGFGVDVITQTDLHYRPEILEDYACATIVGHDEYWSRRMRENLDAYVEGGGRFARFGANFLWQIRLEDEGRKQVCYKYRARAEDPLRDTDQRALLSSAWEDTLIDWPGATTVGVNGFRGVYTGFGGFNPRNSMGFTVYRPQHWAFAGTDLYYGDVFGAEARIFGYEVDGLDYTFRGGLPFPTHADGAPPNVEILAMNVATCSEEAHGAEGADYYVLDADLDFKALVLEGEATEAAKDKHRFGSGMIVHMPKGRGEVFTAATCEWVMGLKLGDYYTEQITRNVLKRFCER